MISNLVRLDQKLRLYLSPAVRLYSLVYLRFGSTSASYVRTRASAMIEVFASLCDVEDVIWALYNPFHPAPAGSLGSSHHI